MLRAWLIYDEEGKKRNSDYIAYHKEAGEKAGIHFELRMAEELAKEIPDVLPDFAIVRAIRPLLSKKLEDTGIPVFNSAFVSEICNNKGKTIQYIKERTTIPVTETLYFSKGMLTRQLLEQYPNHVIKSVSGHGGRQVFRTFDEFERIQESILPDDFIIQPFVKGPGKDVRVYVIGKEIIGAVERTSKDGFKSNFSLGGSVENYKLTKQEQEWILQICEVFDFGMVGIDFLIDEKGQFVFNEIEDVVGARMLYQCQPGIKLLERYFAFIIDKILQYR